MARLCDYFSYGVIAILIYYHLKSGIQVLGIQIVTLFRCNCYLWALIALCVLGLGPQKIRWQINPRNNQVFKGPLNLVFGFPLFFSFLH